MAGSHEVRGSIPLGSTTDTRGARRRRRAPLFLPWDGKEGARGAIALGRRGRPACPRPPSLEPVSLIRGRRRGPAPLSRSPGLAGPFERPGGKRAPAAHGHREAGALAPARPRARRPRRTRSGASRRSTTGRGRIRRQRVREPRHRRPAGGARCPEAPLPQRRPVRRRGHRARQQGPEEGARLSAGVRRPRPAPPRARPMRPAAQRGGDAFGAGLHGPRGVRERGIVPVENA